MPKSEMEHSMFYRTFLQSKDKNTVSLLAPKKARKVGELILGIIVLPLHLAPMSQSKNWMFTFNNPGDNKPEVLFKDSFSFLIYQEEKGKKGTPHFQGYIRFNTNRRLGALKKIHKGIHWDIRKGSHDQAVAYCTKAETKVDGPWRFGTEPKPGQRTDLAAVKETIDSGKTMIEVAEMHFTSFVKYERGLRSYVNMKSAKRDWKPLVQVFYGPTGTGKSFHCKLLAPDAYWFFPQENGKWWDGYTGQSDVVIDEFYGSIKWSSLLRLLDRYPMEVETKGGTVNFAAKRIFLTSNQPPQNWYTSENCLYETLARRLEHIIYFPVLGQATQVNLPDAPSLPDSLDVWYSELPVPVDISGFTLPRVSVPLTQFKNQPDVFDDILDSNDVEDSMVISSPNSASPDHSTLFEGGPPRSYSKRLTSQSPGF
ncbi:MAG: putative viral replication protein [Cressdnaviricota sp.]|nr:MAG: putative viral replication protein [Cressdnaviricota sp.]